MMRHVRTKRSLARGFASVWLCAALAPAHLVAQEASPVTDDLAQEQEAVKDILTDVSRRMERLAQTLESTQPEDARRLREATQKVHTGGVEEILVQIVKSLRESNFLEAVGRQDRALKELDEIIGLLEKRRFQEENLEEKLNIFQQALRQASQFADRQKGLLQKTREFLNEKQALAQIKDLQGAVSELKEKQAGLNEGKAAADLDPRGNEQEAAALQAAKALAEQLAAQQAALNERIGGLPPENLPLTEGQDLLRRLSDLLAKGREAAKPPAVPGGEGEKKEAAASGDSREAAGKEAAGGPDAEQKRPAGGEKGESQAGAGKQAQAGSGEKPGETKPAETKPAETGAPAGAAEGESAKGAADAKLAAEARKLEEALSRLAGLDEAAREAVSKELARAAEAAAEAAKAGRSGDRESGAAAGKEAANALQKAMEALGKNVRGMREKNSTETAGLVQEQGLLQGKAEAGAQTMEASAERGSSQPGKEALAQGSEATRRAAAAMQRAAEGLERGDRSGAREAGAQAGRELEAAVKALAAGEKGLAERGEGDRKADLQNKLAQKAAAAAQAAAELEKKLQKKKKEAAEGEGLDSAKKALAEASAAMREAAAAQGSAGKNAESKGASGQSGASGQKGGEAQEDGARGGEELAKKKREEALAGLERAEKALADEERERLERLEKNPVKENAPAQDELARLTRDLAKKLSEEAAGAEAAQQGESLGQAGESMEGAAEKLGEENAEGAEEKQEEALAKLQGAAEELAEEEERLARLKREEQLVSMVEELNLVKEQQEALNADTTKEHGKQLEGEEKGRGSARADRRLKLALAALAKKQGELSERVEGLTKKLEEELSRVFSFVLKNVGADMRQVRELLDDLDAGQYTQFLQKEIVLDVERLVATLREEIEKPPPESGQGQGQGGMSGKPGLVPTLREIVLLKEMQVEVNRGTRDLQDLREASDGKVSEGWERALNRLFQKQGSVSQITEKFIEDFQKANEAMSRPPGEPGGEAGGDAEEKNPPPGGEGEGNGGDG